MNGITNQVPDTILTVAQYVKNVEAKQYAAWSRKNGYFIDGRFVTRQEAEELRPTANVKIVAKIHDHRSTRQKSNGVKSGQ